MNGFTRLALGNDIHDGWPHPRLAAGSLNLKNEGASRGMLPAAGPHNTS